MPCSRATSSLMDEETRGNGGGERVGKRKTKSHFLFSRRVGTAATLRVFVQWAGRPAGRRAPRRSRKWGHANEAQQMGPAFRTRRAPPPPQTGMCPREGWPSPGTPQRSSISGGPRASRSRVPPRSATPPPQPRRGRRPSRPPRSPRDAAGAQPGGPALGSPADPASRGAAAGAVVAAFGADAAVAGTRVQGLEERRVGDEGSGNANQWGTQKLHFLSAKGIKLSL